jgi:diguanylate cyclase (GGDEF)-like protein
MANLESRLDVGWTCQPAHLARHDRSRQRPLQPKVFSGAPGRRTSARNPSLDLSRVVVVDLDRFKSINDRFGHVAGDLVIRDISEILRRSVRIFDVCTRFGGEEFAVMMPGGTAESAGAIAERIRQRVEAYQRSEPDLSELRVTASIGVAVSPAGLTSRDLIERADRALYQAKKTGKNRVTTAISDHTVLPT